MIMCNLLFIILCVMIHCSYKTGLKNRANYHVEMNYPLRFQEWCHACKYLNKEEVKRWVGFIEYKGVFLRASYNMRSEVLIAMLLRIQVFWDVTLCCWVTSVRNILQVHSASICRVKEPWDD